MLLIVVAASLIWMGFSSMGIRESLIESTRQSSFKYRMTKARNLAKSGVELAMSKLAIDDTWGGVQQKSFDSGYMDITSTTTYSLFADRNGSGAEGRQITSVGTFEGVSDTIKAVVHFKPELAPPPSFRYAVASHADLTVGGASLIHTENDDPINANIHTNGNLTVSGSGLIRGYGSYSGSCNLSEAEESKYFQPYKSVPGQGLADSVRGVEFPKYDLASLKAEADVILTGSQTLSGNITLGSESNPKVYYIDGDLKISGNIEGYGCFIVTGDIDVTGTVTIDAITNNDLPNRLGLYAGDDIKLAGNSQVYAQLYAEDELTTKGTTDVYGLAVAKGGVKAGGSMTVHYKPMSDNVIPRTWYVDENGEPFIVSYFE